MTPQDKRLVMAIVEEHGGKYTPACLTKLYTDAHVPYPEMQKLRLCVDAAKENPSHLDMGIPMGNTNALVAPELAAAVAALPPVTDGLDSFQLKPPGLKGKHLFEHMVRFRAHHADSLAPSFIDDLTADQKAIISPTQQDLTVRSILRDAGGSGATKKLAQRKLNNSGAITSHCGLQNQPERIKKLKDALELTASLAEISAGAKKEKAKVKAKETSGLLQSAAAALQKFVSKGNDLDKLTKKDICAISFRYFGVKLKEVGSKPTLVTSLQELITAQPDVLSSVGPNIAEALLSETPPAFAADDIEDDDAQQDPESGDESD